MTIAAAIAKPGRDRHTKYVAGAWGVLMALTAATWWLGADHGADHPADHGGDGLGRQSAMVAILVLTFAKIYVVGHAFMELREAASWLTRVFATWCAALCLVLSVMYLAL